MDPILKRYRAHLGIDYAAPSGTPIKAAGSGRVIYRGRKGGYGKTIIIRHEGGYKTLYAHMRAYRRGIKRGKYVQKGQVIGYVGSTGMSTGLICILDYIKALGAVKSFWEVIQSLQKASNR